MTIAERLCAPHVLQLTPYQSARRIGGTGNLFINANESSAPLIDSEAIHLYPGDSVERMTQQYANYAGVHVEQCLAGRGADEAIELVIRTFCVAGQDSIAQFTPTYGMYSVSALTHNVEVQNLDFYRLLHGDINEIDQLTQAPKVVFVCNPNNPTGELINRSTLIKLIEKLSDKAIVVVDEAYGDFVADQSLADVVNRYSNLVVLRTLSKAFALAGARIGFALADTSIIELLAKVIAPYPIAEPVARLGIEALSSDGINLMANNVQQISANRKRLSLALTQNHDVTEVFEAQGNYVLARFKNAAYVFEQLSNQGIIARDQSKQPGLANCLRFTVGSSEQIDRLIDVLNRL